jgi:hypothetical protein
MMKQQFMNDGGIYLLRVPAPAMPILISTIFSYLASGSKTSIDAIAKLASLKGHRVADPRYKEDISFLPIEEGFRTAVSKQCYHLVVLQDFPCTGKTFKNQCPMLDSRSTTRIQQFSHLLDSRSTTRFQQFFYSM